MHCDQGMLAVNCHLKFYVVLFLYPIISVFESIEGVSVHFMFICSADDCGVEHNDKSYNQIQESFAILH